MTTPNNTPTRSTDNAHEGQPPADTNRVWKSSKLPACPYNRKRALADGLQKEVPTAYLQRMHAEWDMLLPRRVFLTKNVIECCQIPDGLIGHEEKGPLWDILNVLEVAIGSSFAHRIPIPVILRAGKNEFSVWLHAVWSTTDIDDPAPSVTILLPHED